MAGEIVTGADALVVDDKGDVATLIRDVAAQETIKYWLGGNMETVTLLDDIPFGHKVALRLVEIGDSVRKYGEVIGRATSNIPTGAHVHVHNIEGIRGRGDQHQDEV